MTKPPLVLVILDGWGIAPPSPANAITNANTPAMNRLWREYPHTLLHAHGEHVGLPRGQVGNSEAGHMNIGAGRVVVQDSVYISESIDDGTFFKNPAFLEAIQHAKNHNGRVHLMGILSGSQCPHMSPDHLIALSRLLQKHKARMILHFFTDGRDSHPRYARDAWKHVCDTIKGSALSVATVAGRLYLDRKKSWDRTEEIYNALVAGEAKYTERSFEDAITSAYARGETDEFISPTIIRNENTDAKDIIGDNDSIIFYNLRSDRARQLTKPFVQDTFEEANQGSFTRRKVLRNIKFVAMTDFGPDLGEVLTAYPSRDVRGTIPIALREDFRQVYIAETEKYAHVTYFFNGGYREPIAGEHRILVKSKDARSYDEVPEMSSREITSLVLELLKQGWYNFFCLNFANADMLGHTGNIIAARAGCEAVDRAIRQIFALVLKNQGTLVITSDHGNAENIGGDPVNTMHETSPVPFIIAGEKKISLRGEKSGEVGGKLGDIAPTILNIIGLEKPSEMTGENLTI